MPQRAYVWQRDWQAPVAPALAEGREVLDGAVILGAEVEWKSGTPSPIVPDVDWSAVKDFGKPVSVAMRIAPYAGPFEDSGAVMDFLVATARSLVASATTAQVPLAEFQLDFDCAQKKLAGYAKWVRRLREAVAPLPLVITALPSWLPEPEFPNLAAEAHHYVLQVHSVPSPRGDDKTQICDPTEARRWVGQASKLRLPFEIALPTYRSLVGYGPDDKLLGVVSDSVRPAWPASTRIREYSLDADLIAFLVAEWQTKRPKFCTGLLWYRMPVATDENNWRWPTFKAVMAGRAPRGSWQVRIDGSASSEKLPPNPADLVLKNVGETDGPPTCQVQVSWTNASAPLAEALPGWEVRIEKEKQRATFFRATNIGRRLPPGSECAIGWLRLQPGAPFHVEVVSEPGS